MTVTVKGSLAQVMKHIDNRAEIQTLKRVRSKWILEQVYNQLPS